MTTRRTILTTGLALGLAAFRAADDDQPSGSPPVAGVRVTLADGQAPDLAKTLWAFGHEAHIQPEQAAFPNGAWTQLSVTLKLNGQTWFAASNPDDARVFDIIAYSREAETVWRPIWMRMTDELAGEFGAAAIVQLHVAG
jgi:hypothetical protein